MIEDIIKREKTTVRREELLENIELNERELDYENHRFLNDPKMDNLIDILNQLFKPEITCPEF